MAKNSNNRRENLRALIEQHDGPNALARLLGYKNAAFIVTLAGPHPTRDVTEKSARAFEEKLGLPAGWMDEAPSLHKASQESAAVSQAAPPTDTKPQVTADVVNECVRLVAEVSSANHIALPPAKMADVVTLVLADAMRSDTGPRPEFVKSIVLLFKP